MSRLLRPVLAGTALGAAVLGLAVPAQAAPGWRITHRTAADYRELHDVTALNATTAWAVGSRQDSIMLVERWDGRAWREMPVPAALAPEKNAVLERVVATSAKDVWAIGAARKDGVDGLTIFGVHWDGTRWTGRTFAKNAWLNDVTTTGAPGEVWVSGGGAPCKAWSCKQWIQRFDGKTWRAVPVPNDGAYRLGARKGTGVWASADLTKHNTRESRQSLTRWTGKKWQAVAAPKFSVPKAYEAIFSDIHAVGPKDVWATVSFQNSAGGGYLNKSALVHWNGKKWKQYPVKAKRLVSLAHDGKKGFWMASSSGSDLFHIADAKVSAVAVPSWGGRDGDYGDLALIPGTRSLWAAGTLGRQGVIWKYGA
ncbi:hypothetical protein [Actinomadura macrotermitis]|uniref:Uncharacterized protein n=1 Tax=Actinomadura macrotermitis TaxID=2585200 RepID=A0A7K0BRQ7_9ACTN|nr:hypothetical protein [Actinomadura macrotermitis]MQY03817.1 hypothetical protein [Actinomadura macrotermitis]